MVANLFLGHEINPYQLDEVAMEVRAWTLHKGETSVDAAGTIHTDLARGFIRA